MFQEEFNSIITDHANIMDIPVADVKGISERYQSEDGPNGTLYQIC